MDKIKEGDSSIPIMSVSNATKVLGPTYAQQEAPAVAEALRISQLYPISDEEAEALLAEWNSQAPAGWVLASGAPSRAA